MNDEQLPMIVDRMQITSGQISNTGEESYWRNEENLAADVGDNEQEISIDNETDDAPVFSIFDIANILEIFKLKENVSRSGMDSLLALYMNQHLLSERTYCSVYPTCGKLSRGQAWADKKCDGVETLLSLRTSSAALIVIYGRQKYRQLLENEMDQIITLTMNSDGIEKQSVKNNSVWL
ncbi:unnamed protein product [Didymodactylos carnosus]|uniref:Uncharacterized protein n=1 Tax=Didymodactylos carnosus TaxID=1234261 RepID=A0A814KZS9_9BILA|nr:unnamed protein product [Didymodactylos carnosus]CAF3827654.1 unnamed protein product [Didymodactylos carnosus]